MNDLGNNLRSPVANPKVFLQDLESAVVAAVPESTVKHVKWHGCGRHAFFRREGKSRLGIDEVTNQLLVLTRARFRETSCQLRRRDIVDGVHADNRSVAPIFANGRCEPLKPFFIHGITRKHVTRVPQWHCSVALEFSPHLHPLTCSLRGQRKRQQQPSYARLLGYDHSRCMLYL